MLEDSGPDLFDLAVEADCLAAKVRNARCCDALRPCRSCQLLRTSVLARRIVIRVPRVARRRPVLALPAPARTPAVPALLAS
jgi:hypothetical protein